MNISSMYYNSKQSSKVETILELPMLKS